MKWARLLAMGLNNSPLARLGGFM